MHERRTNPIGRAATADIPRITLGGLRLAVIDLEQTADFMIDLVRPQRRTSRPLHLTSANGEVLARCSTEPMTDRLFRAADLINADGQPLVIASRFKSKTPLPERVATTDLFHAVARKAQDAGLSFYMLGADEAENANAVANVRKAYPDLKIIGRCHGYLRGEALRDKVDEINALAPDISGSRLAFPMSRPLSRNSRRAFPMSASSRRPVGCSTSCPANAPARPNGCRPLASNGPGASGWSRAGCSGAI
jgi:N-acetylglucosaminyldiphosphoundecaprenol N-acetyl-beta-D-mannosaminyltransferase